MPEESKQNRQLRAEYKFVIFPVASEHTSGATPPSQPTRSDPMGGDEPEELAILFADVAGSTHLYERKGDAFARRVIGLCLGFLRQVVQTEDGLVIKEMGDEVMCTFSSAEHAAAAAIEMQRTIAQACSFGKFENEQLRIRVGFHHGPIVRGNEDVFGDAVNVAARVVAQAKAQQILTTLDTMEHLPAERRANARLIDRVMVKGKSQEIELHELLWDIDNLTVLQDGLVADGIRITSRLTFAGHEFFLDAAHPILRLGRGTENDIVVPDTLASRLHARVELRKNKVVLVDQSLNGTYYRMEGESEGFLRRDEQTLRGRGVISLGRSPDSNAELRVLFTCG
jgi:adenylate cyclase